MLFLKYTQELREKEKSSFIFNLYFDGGKVAFFDAKCPRICESYLVIISIKCAFKSMMMKGGCCGSRGINSSCSYTTAGTDA
jgi:hypothetical protein